MTTIPSIINLKVTIISMYYNYAVFMIIILLLLFVDAGLVDEADAMDAVAAQIFAQGVDLL